MAVASCVAFLAACGTSERVGIVTYPGVDAAADGGNIGVFGTDDAASSSSSGGSSSGGASSGGDGGTRVGSDGAITNAEGHELVFAMPNGNKDDFKGVCNKVCALQVHQNGLRNIYVRLLKDGKAVPNDGVKYALEKPADAQLGKVTVQNALTDENGKASGQVKTFQNVGMFRVIATAPGHEGVKPIAFEVHVISKAKGPLTLRMDYKGIHNPLDFAHNKFRLSLQAAAGQPACKDIDLGSPPLPQAQWESPPNMQLNKPWTITYPSFVSWVKKQQIATGGAPLTFTVLAIVAKSPVKPAIAGGCVDTGASVTFNPKTQALEGDDVIVHMTDIPPRMAGTYEMTTYLDMLSILPDPVELVFKTIFDILTDPIAGTLALACKLGGSSLDSFCGLVFADPKKPNINDLKQPFGALVVKLLNGVLLAVLPKEVKTGMTAGADLGKILTNMEMGGYIHIKKEPDNTGFLSKDFTKDEITSFTYKWSLGQNCNPKDPNCGKKTFSISQFQQDTIVGKFDLWRNVPLSRVKFGKHGLNVKWGALISFIVQKQLLPLLTNPTSDPKQPVVDSYEKLIKSLLADKKCLFKDTCCEDFAKNLEKQQSLIKAPFLTGVCEALIKLGTGFLDAQLAKLDVDTSKGDGLILFTDKCPLFEVDGDQHIDAIGSKVEFCSWNMTLKLGGKPQKIDAKFFAVRQN